MKFLMPQLAGLNLLRELVEPAGRDRDVAAHDLGQHSPPAPATM